MKQDSANQVWNPKPGSQASTVLLKPKKRPLGAVEENIRVYLTRTQILTIKNKEYNRVTSAHQYIMGVKTFILFRRKVRPLGTQRSIMKGEKMIWAVLQEEIGGKEIKYLGQQFIPPCICGTIETDSSSRCRSPFVASRGETAKPSLMV
ncbi:hypothetical protein RHMOL_Rhmol04G0270900 [Rhododendron molle]|uniref:Uncharacterized protein n=1 Tax=Rhododendron molle TaxID=49168 RepID=A0ACC0P522_RHOML|nr:hypothetical protein RHMOL_Rhmol04G0270900 [Rhododendron molle]